VNVVVLADTHLRSGLDGLSAHLLNSLRRADAILHAGDVVSAEALAGLREMSEVYAVLGNNDHPLVGVLPQQLSVELAGVHIGLLHDSGPSAGRAARMARRFPDAHVVVFGHSHIPVNESGVGDQVLFNPGSATLRRTQPNRTFGRLRLVGGRVRDRAVEIID